MQGEHDMTLELMQDATTVPHTTAAGLDAWLAGGTSDQGPANGAVLLDMTSGEVGPVNAAEALALGKATSARKLTGPDGAELVIDPAGHAYHFESTELKPLLAILQQPASRWTPVGEEAMLAARAAHPAQPLERLLWFAGLVATPGILGRRLTRTGRYRLTGWPETEREFPKHFRIAKAMLKDAVTVDEIVAESATPYEEVIDYINASHAAGRLEAASPAAAKGGRASPSRASRFMARLNRPLFAR